MSRRCGSSQTHSHTPLTKRPGQMNTQENAKKKAVELKETQTLLQGKPPITKPCGGRGGERGAGKGGGETGKRHHLGKTIHPVEARRYIYGEENH